MNDVIKNSTETDKFINSTLTTISCHARPITDLKFNKDGDLIFTASKDSTSAVIRTDGSPLGVYQGHEGSIFTISLNPSSTSLLTGSADLSVINWDMETGVINTRYNVNSVVKCSDNFFNDNLFVTGSDESIGKQKCYNIIDSRSKNIEKTENLEFNPTGAIIEYSQNFIIFSDDEGVVYKIDLRNNQIVLSNSIHNGQITNIKSSLCSTFFISSSTDAQAKIVDCEDLNSIKTFVSEESINSADIFITNDKVVCVGGIDARDVTTTNGKHGFDTNFYDVVTSEKIGFFTT
ncbi:MAG: hypothetical protein ACRCZW_07330, partial [Lactobacillaceae bacterium]